MERASETANPTLVPQPGGRGALYSGGKPGNSGGGRPPSALRAVAREHLDERLEDLNTIAESSSVAAKDRVSAIALLAKIGLYDHGVGKRELNELMRGMAEVVKEHAPEVADVIFLSWEALLVEKMKAAPK